MSHRAGFTLVELLIVIGVVAVLATVVALLINPAEFIARGRDTKRNSDIDTLNKALEVYESQGGSFSNAITDKVYISLPDSNAVESPAAYSDCATTYPNLPTLPAGWEYRCAHPNNYRKTDGNGWIPLNFSQIAGLSISTLPIDPTNSDTNQLYYTFIKGSWNLTAKMESNKLTETLALTDPGTDPARYEKGSDSDLWSEASGLVGYWKLDESSGSTAADSSINGNTGTVYGSPTSVAGKVGNAMDFDGMDDYVQIDSPDLPTGDFTYMAWLMPTSAKDLHTFMVSEAGTNEFIFKLVANHKVGLYLNNVNLEAATAGGTATAGEWNHIALTRSGTTYSTYLNGSFEVSLTDASVVNFGACPLMIATDVDSACTGGLGNWADGAIDEARIYSRALSASEIQAIYNATR